MIIDPDESNGDLIRTVSLLRQYETIHGQLNFDSSLKSSFFSTPITALNNDGSYLLPLIGTKGINFDKYLNLSSMSQENQAFAKMLFSNANLSSTMNVGFKGNPNIGSVVLNQFTQSNVYKKFESGFVTGDKVFVISSIFGGTGASGFPLLLKSMRTSKNAALAKAPIGAVTLLPYFNLQSNPKSSIKDDSFITKTKAALNYYEKNVTGNGTLNEMYYLGDDFSGYGYENCDGGDNQMNDAHIIELLASLALFDFDAKELGAPTGTNFHEFGLQSQPKKEAIFSDFGNITRRKIELPLTMMSILNSYLNNRDKNHRTSQRWAKDRNGVLGESFFASSFFDDYTRFKKEFEEWQSELARNHMGFKPFNDDANIRDTDGLEKVVGITPKYSGLFIGKKKGYDLIDVKLGNKLPSIQDNLSPQVTFMELFYVTLKEICAKNLNIQ